MGKTVVADETHRCSKVFFAIRLRNILLRQLDRCAMVGTQAVIDLANSPSFEDKAALEFFETSGHNLLAAETAAGVRQLIPGDERRRRL